MPSKSPFYRTFKNLVLKTIIFIAAIFISFSPKSTCQSLSHFCQNKHDFTSPKNAGHQTKSTKSAPRPHDLTKTAKNGLKFFKNPTRSARTVSYLHYQLCEAWRVGA